MAQYTQSFLYDLSAKLFDNIDALLDELGVDLKVYGDRYTGICPIHSGADNASALSIRNGIWYCYTHHCEKTFNRNLIGFVRGVLSKNSGWTSEKDAPISFSSTLKWIFDFLKVDKSSIGAYNTYKNDSIFLKRKTNQSKLTRPQIRQRLRFPAEFLLKRGFKKEVLDAYDIGVCLEKGKPMAGRVIVPIFDDSHKYMVGCLGRSINELCSKCNKYHFGQCPDYDSAKFNKWINSKGFYADSYLFNYWKAKDEIKRTGSVVLVEGPLDCLKLIQVGINNVVALFGNNISDEQTILLERFPLQKIQILTDNDEPGIKGKKQIQEQCKHLCKVNIVDYDKHDPGELTKEEIEKLKEKL